MKIGIVTITDYSNYGNRLQNYALQETLKNMGHEVVSIRNVPLSKKHTMLNILGRGPKAIGELVVSKIFKRSRGKSDSLENLDQLRKNKLKQFSDAHLNETEYYINSEDWPENIELEFDYFIVGSDQVWNPDFRMCSPVDFLRFTKNKKQRISYSASFGVDCIERKYRKKYIEWLKEFNHISVREERGSQIVKELIGVDVPVLLDPTMLLDEKIWSQLAENLPMISEQYLLTYILGTPNDEESNWIKQVANKNNLKIVNLADKNNAELYAVELKYFLGAIKNASVFVTDSFHGVVFSILFSTPFVVFERRGNKRSMNSRIETLLKKFSFQDRTMEKQMRSNSLFDISFSDSINILKSEREKSIAYLKDAFDNKAD